jgi:DNA-binding transcriptional ArsR family regulator
METTWVALADPNRRALLDLLRGGPQSVNELVDALAVSQPTASKHLKVLRTAGLVRVRPDAQRRIYEIEPGGFRDLDVWLAPYRAFWNDRLDALSEHLNRSAERVTTQRKPTTKRRPR